MVGFLSITPPTVVRRPPSVVTTFYGQVVVLFINPLDVLEHILELPDHAHLVGVKHSLGAS